MKLHKTLYKNFDGLDVSFQGAVPIAIREQLAIAKEEAQKERGEVLIKLGKHKLPVMVAETGGRGGYAYRFDTGNDGIICFIADSSKTKMWNIRLSVKSLTLAIHGYHKVKEMILDTLAKLEAIGPEGGLPKETISRFDFCVDYILENFTIDPNCIVAHSNAKRSFNVEAYNGKGKVIESVRIGTMPNRQVAIYNKSKEIASSKKSYWWDLWNIKKHDLQEHQTIWRVEIRAGKEELKKWNIRSFTDFESMAGDVVRSIVSNIRYVEPNQDSNQARWPDSVLWQQTVKTTEAELFNYTSYVIRKQIMEGLRETVLERYETHIRGMLVSYAAALDIQLDDLKAISDIIAANFHDYLNEQHYQATEKYQKAKDKFQFLT